MSSREVPVGWIKRSRFSNSYLYMVVFPGTMERYKVSFRVPRGTLERVLKGESKACPVFWGGSS